MSNGLPIHIEVPKGFLEEEIRCGFKVSALMKSVWAVELDILHQIDAICKRHGIRYFAECGTLLGAVRHHGFIPWDDDIDILMLRPDYDRFISIATKELKHPYFLQNQMTDEYYFEGHSKVRNVLTRAETDWGIEHGVRYCQGIFVDIFPYDGVGTESQVSAQKVALKHMVTWRERHAFPRKPGLSGFARWCVSELYHVCNPPKKLYERQQQVLRSIDVGGSRIIASQAFLIGAPSRYVERNWYRETVMLPFEFIEMPVPVDYEKVLTVNFGDWKTPVRCGAFHGAIHFFINGIGDSAK